MKEGGREGVKKGEMGKGGEMEAGGENRGEVNEQAL